MKKILTLSLLAILFSSFLTGDYFEASKSSSIEVYSSAFPLIKNEHPQFVTVFPANSVAGLDAAKKGDFRIWYENGLGNYSKTIKDGWVLATASSSTKYDPIMLASILYETPRRPPGTSAHTFTDPTSGEPNESEMLNPGRRIKLFQNTQRIVSEDPMVYAISYRLDGNLHDTEEYRIVLKYNNGGKDISRIFTPLVKDDQIDIPQAFAQTSASGEYTLNSNKIPSVRTFAKEVQQYHANGNSILSADELKSSLISDPEIKEPSPEWPVLSFRDAVIFDTLANDTAVHNLFVTLSPEQLDAELVKKNPPVFLEAVLQKRTKEKSTKEAAKYSDYSDVETSRAQDVAADAHDPNEVIVSPLCINLPQKRTSLHYRVNFENTGAGDANKIIVVFNSPAQVKVNAISNLFSSCGGRRTTGAGANQVLVRYDQEKNGRFIFYIEGALKGTASGSGDLTKGGVEFDLDVSPAGDVSRPVEMKAWADIFFHSASGDISNDVQPAQTGVGKFPVNTAGYELPVTTDPAITVYKERCEQCNCPPQHGCWLCTWWWLVALLIILLILLPWYFFCRRPRHQNAP